MSRVRFLLTLFIALAFPIALYSQRNISVASPNGVVNLTVINSGEGILSYSITYKKKKIIETSDLGFSFSKPAIQLNKFIISAIDTVLHDETWKPVWGEVSQIRNYYKELNVALEDKAEGFAAQCGEVVAIQG